MRFFASSCLYCKYYCIVLNTGCSIWKYAKKNYKNQTQKTNIFGYFSNLKTYLDVELGGHSQSIWTGGFQNSNLVLHNPYSVKRYTKRREGPKSHLLDNL